MNGGELMMRLVALTLHLLINMKVVHSQSNSQSNADIRGKKMA